MRLLHDVCLLQLAHPLLLQMSTAPSSGGAELHARARSCMAWRY